MPIYAYKCSACGFAKDVLQKMSDAPLTRVSVLRRQRVRQAADGRRFPAQGFGLVRDGFPRRRRQGKSKDKDQGKRRAGAATTESLPTATRLQANRRSCRRRPRSAPAAPAPGAARLAAGQARACQERLRTRHARAAQMAALRSAGDRAAGHHAGRAQLDHRHARPDALAAAGELAALAQRAQGARPRRAADAGHPADRRRHRQQLHRQAAARLGRPDRAAHPGGALDLFERQAGVGHAVLRKRQRLPHRRAGRSGRARACGPSPSSPARPAATWRTTCGATTSASTCRPRPTRPAAIS